MNILHKTQDDLAADRYALLEKLGIEYLAAFVPQAQSRNSASKYKSINWKVTIKRGSQSLTTDYMQGIGHANIPQPSFAKLVSANLKSIAADEKMRHLVENGWYMLGVLQRVDQPAPDRNDVLHSLCLDSEVLDYPTFEEWADNFGYDRDSRKAEKIYRDCLEIALRMRAIFGNSDLTKLRATFEDY